MLIDLAARRVVAVPEAVFAAADAADAPVLGEMPFSKFRFPEVPQGRDAPGAAPVAFRAQKSHIDLNGHVNNVHYVEWMLEPCDSQRPGAIEVAFRSETFVGDEVRVACARAGDRTFLRVFAPDGRDHAVAWTEP